MSDAISLKSPTAGGVYRLIRISRSTNTVGMPVDALRLRRSSFALPVSATVSESSRFNVTSSSLTDCSSSLPASNSSVVARSSSLIACNSSFDAINSSANALASSIDECICFCARCRSCSRSMSLLVSVSTEASFTGTSCCAAISFRSERTGIFHRRMHLLLRAMQVMFEIDEFVGICIDRGVVHGHVLLRGNLVFDFVEEHDDHVFATAVILEQPCRYIDERGSLAARKAHAPRHYAITVEQYAMQRGPQLRAQLRVDEREQIARRLTADILKETSGVIGHMQDRAITIHGDVRRRIALEYALTQRRQRRWRLVPQTGPPGDVEGRGADQRQRRHSARTNPFRLVNAVALVHLFEQVARDLDRFRAAEKQKTARPQRKVKRLQHLALYGFIEVDQQVAARDQVHSRKRRITQGVVDGEHHFLTQFLAHLVTATGLHK